MRTIIELDCGDMPPACGFECGVCVQEIKETVEAMEGVSGFAEHLDSRIEIEHDPEKISQQDLLEAVAKLPSSQPGFFNPTLAKS
jgi:copper chaperone CopZ